MLKDMEDFLGAVPQVLGDGALKPAGDISVAGRLDSAAKSNFKTLLLKLQDSRSELAAIHSMNEEERERTMAKRALMKRKGLLRLKETRTPHGVEHQMSLEFS